MDAKRDGPHLRARMEAAAMARAALEANEPERGLPEREDTCPERPSRGANLPSGKE